MRASALPAAVRQGTRPPSLARNALALALITPCLAAAQVVVDTPRTTTVNLDSEPGSNAATAQVTAGTTVNTTNGEALVGQNFRWTLDNYGQLISADPNVFAVRLQNGETFHNHIGAVVQGVGGGFTAINSAATVTNEGRIAASVGPGLELRAGGFLLNAAGAEVVGGNYGVRLINSSNGLLNAGLIEATNGEALHVEGGAGDVINANTAVVSGTTHGVNLVNGGVTLINAGRVEASTGVGVTTNSGGTVINQQGAAIRAGTVGISMTNGTAAINNTGLIQGGTYSLRFETGNGTLTQDSGALLIGSAYGAGSSRIVLHGEGVASNDFLQFASLNVDAQRWSLLGRTEATATTVTTGQLWLGAPGLQGAVLSGNTVDIGTSTTLAGTGSRIEGAVSNHGTLAVGSGLVAWSPSPGALDIVGSLDNRAVIAATDGVNFGNVLQVSGSYHGLGAIRLGASVNEAHQGALANQRADRLLVRGDASGLTGVVVTATSGTATGASAAYHGPDAGVSLIQVSGQSTASAFLLARPYVTGGTPFRYRLYAYGPGAANGAASPAQNLVGNPGGYWDYRLQRGYETAIPLPPGVVVIPGGGDGDGGGSGGGGGTGGGGGGTGGGSGGGTGGGTGGGGSGGGSGVGAGEEEGRYELAPQVPGYLAMLNGLISTGWDDLDNLHRRLGEVRRADDGQDTRQDSEMFLRAHGGRARFAPHLSFAEYGYAMRQDYRALQLGGSALVPSEGSGVWRIGAAVTLGRAGQEPELRDAEADLRVDTRTWMLIGTWMSAGGMYVDLQGGYGVAKGRKRVDMEGEVEVARPRGSRWLASVETGWPFSLGGSAWGLEPQLQLAWQDITVDPFSDSEGLRVAGRSESAGLGRLGVRLYRNPDEGLAERRWEPWLRLDYLEGFDDGGQLDISGVTFRTDHYGRAWRAGAGLSARLGKGWDLYGEGYWQGRFNNEGWEAWNAVVGARVRW
ncbi:autotransporter outer membrane beta-barrel domain-containing protein [Stenotrophomonas oahuensis]|uniref:Autotransporter outer membrane beta-barrel domain-containing protein n=1 Tax=Stenotrophomonas oahuensis TaxID=3003271 RepID=A0ABY9YRM8_9GAMM|nr:autotransporter outer membrane beta-barrel domain-containing protein [Stenotrophomonas sp. A5586]WNH52844.1 autotransporter outer membrane beta-barrel domain-containing protein [Stenotrophomonas sp. A5586]